MPKMVNFGEFLKTEACGQTVLPDGSILIGQKLVENAQNGPFWRVFETLKLAVKQCYQTGQY